MRAWEGADEPAQTLPQDPKASQAKSLFGDGPV